MKELASGCVALAVALSGAMSEQQTTGQPAVQVGRSKIATKYGIVAASQPLAARAGVQILERGGNAVDAAIAANAVMGAGRAAEQRHRRRPVRDLLRGEDRQAVRPERGRLGAERADARVPAVQGIHADAEYAASTPSPFRARSRAGRCSAAGSGRCRCPTCWRRRSSTPRTDSPSRSHRPCMAGSFGQACRRAPRGGSLSAERPRAACGRDLQEPCTGGDAATDRAKRAPPASTKARRPTRFSPSSASRAAR